MESYSIKGPGAFQFSGVRFEDLGATEYTLVTNVVDVTGSVINFRATLDEMLKTIVRSCQKHPRAENILLRLVLFNETVEEVHGFLPLIDINPDDYEPLHPRGMTALYDAVFNAVGATMDYAKILVNQDFDVNGAVYIITDGDDNRSKLNPNHIKEKVEQALRDENIESLVSVLIGLKDPNDPDDQWLKHVSRKLEQFKNESALTQYVDAGDATPEKLAKLAAFVSESISSQSQALGTGAPSQTLSF
jgi:hypothetical protein